MEKLGTSYGGWYIPIDMSLNANSIVYSGGVGEDMSFDILLQNKYNCYIYLIDPTLKAIKHFSEVKYYYNNNKLFTGNIQKDYYSCIQSSHPNFEKMKYLNIGLWNKTDILKFYRQNNENYVSQSLLNNMFGDKYDIVPVDSIKNVMKTNGHTMIDLLKLDIEGAEVVTVCQMLDDKIFPTYILIEFDLLLKNKDANNTTKKLIERLIIKENYKIFKNDNLNITFIRNI